MLRSLTHSNKHPFTNYSCNPSLRGLCIGRKRGEDNSLKSFQDINSKIKNPKNTQEPVLTFLIMDNLIYSGVCEILTDKQTKKTLQFGT